MHPKTKTGAVEGKTDTDAIRTLMQHETSNQVVSNKEAARRSRSPIQPASGAANHARHHVSRQTQS